MVIDQQLLSRIIEIRHLEEPDDVNLMLKAGWIILNTNPIGKQRKVLYSLGWDKNKGLVIDAIEDREKRLKEGREASRNEDYTIENVPFRWESR